ncbi:MAG: hypothetical protein RBS80_19785 [Thermoguttaceae bacterium]|jgi:hypothetical protein|nr:hypothetical protein [Thermoguttaceae bacterium]
MPVRQWRYFTLPLILGLALGVIAILGCGAAAVLPWMNIPQLPSSTATGDIARWDFFSQSVDKSLGERPNVRKFWWFPLTFVPLILIAVFMPIARLRGGILLGSLLVGSVAWFAVVGLIQSELGAWRPIARLVENPHILSARPPGDPGLGLAAWVMIGVGVLLLIATMVNLCRSPGSTFIVVGPVVAVGILGVACLNYWCRPTIADIRMEATVSDATVTGGGFMPATSETVAVLSVGNHASHPVVLIPADLPQRQSGPAQPTLLTQQPGSVQTEEPLDSPSVPGQWASAWGRPDLVLSIEPDPDQSTSLRPGGNRPAVAFEDGRSLGCVIRAGQAWNIVVRFAPVWDEKQTARASMAGSWLACLRNADGKTVASTSLRVQSVVHPDDQRIEELSDKFQAALATAEDKAAKLSKLVDSQPEQQAAAAPAVARSIAAEFKGVRESLQACHSAISDLTKLGTPPPDQDKVRMIGLTERISLPGESLVALLDALDRRRFPEAVVQLDKLQELAASGSELAIALQHLLSAIVVDEAQSLLEEEQSRETVALLMAVAEDTVDDSRKDRAAVMLVSGAVALLRDSQLGLVTPNGSMGTGRIEAFHMSRGTFTTKETEADQFFETVVRRVRAWTKELEANSDFAYLDLCAKRLAGRLDAADVLAFGRMRPEAHGDDASCWLGMKSLQEGNPGAAAKYFAYVLATWPAGEYAALARLGQGIAEHAAAEDDVLARIPLERTLIESREQRQDWATDVRRLLPPTLPARRDDLDWIDGIALLAGPDEASQWLAGTRHTIPWLRMGATLPQAEEASELRKLASEGQIIMADASSFEALTGLRCQEPEERLLRNQAMPVRQWDNRVLGYPFLREIQGVQYDSQASGRLMLLKSAAAAGTSTEAFLQVDKEWLACVARLYTKNRGAVVFLPDRIIDTPDGRRFLRLLVEFSLNAVRENRGEAHPAAPARGHSVPFRRPGR